MPLPISNPSLFISRFVKKPLKNISSDNPVCKNDQINARIKADTSCPANCEVTISVVLVLINNEKYKDHVLIINHNFLDK